MSRHEHRRLRWAQLVLVLIGLLGSACEAPSLKVTLAGCFYLRADGSCEVSRDIKGQFDELRLLVEASPQTEISVFQGWRGLSTTIDHQDRGRLVRVRPLAGVSSLTVVARRGITWQRQVLQVHEWTAAEWVQKAFDTWAFRGHPEVAERELRERLREPQSLPDEAWALGILARIALEGNRISEAEDLFRRALKADQKAGLISNVIRDSFRLKEILATHQQRFESATRLLDSIEDAVQQDPGSRSWLEYNRGLVELEQDRLVNALKHAEAGEQWAQRFGDLEAIRELRAMQAEVLQRLNRTHEANVLFRGLADSEPSPCRRAELYLGQGRVGRHLLEGPQTAKADATPEVPLQAALRIYRTPGESGCSHQRRMRRVLLELAQVAVLHRNPKEAQEWLQQLEHGLSSQDVESNRDLQPQIFNIKGQIALQEAQTPDSPAEVRQSALKRAQSAFEEMKKQSIPPTSAQSVHDTQALLFHESYWQALVGIAEAQRAMKQYPEALKTCLEADSYLANYGLSLPLGASRGGFLGRHERGSSLCLTLFLECNQQDAAFNWLREVRVRASLPLLGVLQRTTDQSTPRSYVDLRKLLDKNVQEEELAAQDRIATLRQERVHLYEQLLETIETLAPPAQPPAKRSFRPLAQGELALICHPGLGGGWICIAATSTQKVSFRVDKLGKGVDRERLAQDLLGPIDPLLRSSRVLRVLAYGNEMRTETDIHLLPRIVNGKSVPLWNSGIDVVYALDLPLEQINSNSGERRIALLVADPQQNLPELRKVADELETAFRVKNWRTIVQIGGEQTYGRWPNQQESPTPAALQENLRTMLETADLFLYMGHAAVERPAGWTHALRTAREAGLLVTDILLLSRVPRQVILLGCETAESSEETGGQEALGIAQSFVARGAEAVIATQRPVKAAWVATLARALSRQGLTGQTHDLVDLLRRSISELAAQPENAAEDLGTFRVVVP